MEAKEIIQSILDYLGMTPTEFGRSLGLDKFHKVFDLQSGKTKSVSNKMVQLIKQAYPAFNEEWLRTGEGEMLEYEMPGHVFNAKAPQEISNFNAKEAMSVIQRLSLQLDSKEDIIRRLIDANDRLTRQLEECLGTINELTKSNGRLSSAFQKLVEGYMVGGNEEKC